MSNQSNLRLIRLLLNGLGHYDGGRMATPTSNALDTINQQYKEKLDTRISKCCLLYFYMVNSLLNNIQSHSHRWGDYYCKLVDLNVILLSNKQNW